MGQFSPAAINITVLAVALLLYGLVWYATRNMSRFAQVLARLSPVGLVIPAMVYVSALTTGMVGKEAARPVQEPIVESVREGQTDTAPIRTRDRAGAKARWPDPHGGRAGAKTRGARHAGTRGGARAD